MKELEQLIRHWIVNDQLNDMALGQKIRAWYWKENKDDQV